MIKVPSSLETLSLSPGNYAFGGWIVSSRSSDFHDFALEKIVINKCRRGSGIERMLRLAFHTFPYARTTATISRRSTLLPIQRLIVYKAASLGGARYSPM